MQTTKNTICIIIITIFFGLNLFAQDSRDLSMLDKNAAKWSLGVKGGIDYFFVKPHAESETNFKAAVIQASWVAPVLFGEYTYNDIFSFGLESGYFAYNRGNTLGSYAGGTFDAALYASFNLSNLNKYRHGFTKRVSWYGQVGLGAGYYYYKNNYSENGVRVKQEGNGFTPLSFAGITCAVNLTDSWELFAEGQYRAYIERNMGGESVKLFTSAFAAFLGVRFKIF